MTRYCRACWELDGRAVWITSLWRLLRHIWHCRHYVNRPQRRPNRE